MIRSFISWVGEATFSMPHEPSIGPGEMPLTRMPSGPHSSARTLMSMLTPALAAHTCAWKLSGLTASGAVIAIKDAPRLLSTS